jgi:lipoate-protein ligase A
MVWRLLPTLSAPMPLQMALDELLFTSQKKDPRAPILRFYVSSAPWISVGCSFRDESDLSRSGLISKYPHVPACRRITGGGCVLHGKDLIFSLTAPVQFPELDSNSGNLKGLGSVRTSYAKIHEAVKLGLQSCGVDPKFYAPEDDLPKGRDCFDFPVESDLSWKGSKIAGGAQKRSEGVLLHHESILIPENVGRDDLTRAVCRGMEQVFGVSIRKADLDPEIYFYAEKRSEI